MSGEKNLFRKCMLLLHVGTAINGFLFFPEDQDLADEFDKNF